MTVNVHLVFWWMCKWTQELSTVRDNEWIVILVWIYLLSLDGFKNIYVHCTLVVSHLQCKNSFMKYIHKFTKGKCTQERKFAENVPTLMPSKMCITLFLHFNRFREMYNFHLLNNWSSAVNGWIVEFNMWIIRMRISFNWCCENLMCIRVQPNFKLLLFMNLMLGTHQKIIGLNLVWFLLFWQSFVMSRLFWWI